MPKAKSSVAKSKAKSRPDASATKAVKSEPRRLKTPKYQTFRLHKRIQPAKALPSSFKLLGRSLLVLKRHWRLFLTIALIYGFLNLLLVRGLSGGGDLSTIKTDLNQSFNGQGSQFGTSLTLFAYLLGNSGNSSNANSGLFQTLLIILVSLATIWTLRQIYSDVKVRMRDGFYLGITPLIPFILVLLVIGLQLLPLLLGGLLYTTVTTGGIAVYTVEKILWGLVFAGLALISLYLITSSLFALYVVTLPDMTPMKALRSARELVRNRRWEVLRKVLFLPVALLIMAAVIMLPLILVLTVVSEWLFFAMTIVGLLVVHSYMYALYRELLQ